MSPMPAVKQYLLQIAGLKKQACVGPYHWGTGSYLPWEGCVEGEGMGKRETLFSRQEACPGRALGLSRKRMTSRTERYQDHLPIHFLLAHPVPSCLEVLLAFPTAAWTSRNNITIGGTREIVSFHS